MIEKDNNLESRSKIYVDTALKAASHPIRRNILKLVKQGSYTTTELEEKTNVKRYDLYYHLDMLVKAKLINKIEVPKGKTYYELNILEKPVMIAFNFDKNEIKDNSELCEGLFDTIEKIEDYNLPNTKKISKIEVYFTYDWEGE